MRALFLLATLSLAPALALAPDQRAGQENRPEPSHVVDAAFLAAGRRGDGGHGGHPAVRRVEHGRVARVRPPASIQIALSGDLAGGFFVDGHRGLFGRR